MLFPTRLEVTEEQERVRAGTPGGREATRAERVAASRPLPFRRRQLTALLPQPTGSLGVSQQGVPGSAMNALESVPEIK